MKKINKKDLALNKETVSGIGPKDASNSTFQTCIAKARVVTLQTQLAPYAANPALPLTMIIASLFNLQIRACLKHAMKIAKLYQ